MDKAIYEVGDVLETKGVYVRVIENMEKIDRGLVVRSFIDKDEYGDARYYVVLFIPTKFRDNIDFTYKAKVRTMTEEFLNKNSKKIDHVDLTPFVV